MKANQMKVLKTLALGALLGLGLNASIYANENLAPGSLLIQNHQHQKANLQKEDRLASDKLQIQKRCNNVKKLSHQKAPLLAPATKVLAPLAKDSLLSSHGLKLTSLKSAPVTSHLAPLSAKHVAPAPQKLAPAPLLKNVPAL